jgi:hypothetical protein
MLPTSWFVVSIVYVFIIILSITISVSFIIVSITVASIDWCRSIHAPTSLNNRCVAQ